MPDREFKKFACLQANFLKFMADRAKARESGKSLISRTCTANILPGIARKTGRHSESQETRDFPDVHCEMMCCAPRRDVLVHSEMMCKCTVK